MNKKYFDFGMFSKYRDELFGLAIMSIIIFHFTEDYVKAGFLAAGTGAVNAVIGGYYHFIRSIGVEIFLFLSGMGLYYAFSKNEDLMAFYKKRFIRILPTYFLVGGVYWLIRDILISGKGWMKFFKDFSFYTFLSDGNTGLWFIFAILVFYLFYPYLYYLFKEEKSRTIFLAGAMVLYGAFFLVMRRVAPELSSNTSVMMTRIPIFILGCYMGPLIKEHKSISMTGAVLFAAASVAVKILFLIMDVKYMYVKVADVFFCTALMMIFSMLLERFEAAERMRKFLRTGGLYSLELYLIHVGIRRIFKDMGIYQAEILTYLAVVLLSVLLVPLVHSFASGVSRKLNRR